MEMVRTFLPQISLLVLVAVIAVVMPTLYPISAEICQRFASVNYVEMIAAITATSFAAAISRFLQAAPSSCPPTPAHGKLPPEK